MSTPTTSQHSLSCGAYTPGEGGVIVTDGELTVGDTTIAEFWQDAEGGDVRRAQPTGGAWRRHGRGILPRPTRRGRERTDVRDWLHGFAAVLGPLPLLMVLSSAMMSCRLGVATLRPPKAGRTCSFIVVSRESAVAAFQPWRFPFRNAERASAKGRPDSRVAARNGSTPARSFRRGSRVDSRTSATLTSGNAARPRPAGLPEGARCELSARSPRAPRSGRGLDRTLRGVLGPAA